MKRGFWVGAIQGYHSVLIGKQISRWDKSIARGMGNDWYIYIYIYIYTCIYIYNRLVVWISKIIHPNQVLRKKSQQVSKIFLACTLY